MIQQWKSIPGYEGLYSVSSSGLVRSDRGGRGTERGLILKPRYTADGYIKYVLRKGGSAQGFYAHRLVYEAFLGAIPDGMQVDHLDGVKENNHIANLEAVSRLENMQRSFKKGRNMAKGSRVGTSSLTEAVVSEMKNKHRAGMKQARICEEFGVSKSTLSKIILGKSWKHVP